MSCPKPAMPVEHDPVPTSPEVVEKLWADEIQRRVQRVREGRSTGRDGRTVLAEIRSELATRR